MAHMGPSSKRSGQNQYCGTLVGSYQNGSASTENPYLGLVFSDDLLVDLHLKLAGLDGLEKNGLRHVLCKTIG